MGLDMYLIKRKKGENKDLWDFNKEYWRKELIYWRKANQIHKYFCDNGECIEEDRTYKIPKEVLENLLSRCNEVLEIVKTKKGKIQNGMHMEEGKWVPDYVEGIEIINKDEIAEILPTQSGFFFGSTDYDQYYLNDIEYTKKEIEKIFKKEKDGKINLDNWDMYYLASW